MTRLEGDLQTSVFRTSVIAAIPAMLSMPRIPPRLRVGAVGVVYAFAFFAVGVLLAATLPSFAGFHTATVYGGSMGDALPAGSVAVTRPVDAADLEVGDVIAMGGHEAGLPLLHRIVAIEEVDGGRLVTTRGDANQTNDPMPITVSGKGDRVAYHIPWIGYFLAFSRSALGLAVLVGIPATVWAVRELIIVRKAIKRRMERRAQGEPNAIDVVSCGEPGAVFTDRPQEIPSNSMPPALMIHPGVGSTPCVSYVFIPIELQSTARTSGVAPPALKQGRIRATFVGLATVSARRRARPPASSP